MSGILTTARLVFKSTKARETALEAFNKIIAYTMAHEPEVLQYVATLPVDDSLGTEVYMIEEYVNQAASDAHLATKPVQDLIQLFTTGDVLAGAPEVHNCPVKHRKTFGQPLSISSNPAIVLLHSTSSGVDPWKGAVESAKGVNFGAVAEENETESVRTELILDGWGSYEAFEKSEAARTLLKNSESAVKIRPIAGFLGREEKSKL